MNKGHIYATASCARKEQAINIAMDAIKTYSYPMSDDWIVTGFNVTENRIIANLYPQTKTSESNVLYPAWSVTLPLNGTWPGSVRELLVEIWAGTGEVHFVHHQAYGGGDYVPSGSSGSDPSTTLTSPSSSTGNGGASMGISTVAGMAVAAIIAVAITTLLIRKRKK